MKKVAVVLSGAGVMDGSEIHEAVISVLALDRAGAAISFFAPNVNLDEVNHLSNEATGASRNVLLESARIARGKIQDVKQAQAEDFDAILFPGGFGAAKNLCDFAVSGPKAKANEDIAELIKQTHAKGKVIGAMCIAPALIAIVLGDKGVELTIGTDEGTAQAIESFGAKHKKALVDEIVFDEVNKIVSTPAYMLAKSIKEAASGIEKLIAKVLEIA